MKNHIIKEIARKFLIDVLLVILTFLWALGTVVLLVNLDKAV